jgi:hypothetical protein
MSLRIRPGSWIAQYHFGCKCDMINNQFGLGVDLSGNSLYFDVAEDCPIHVDTSGTLNGVEVLRIGAEYRRHRTGLIPKPNLQLVEPKSSRRHARSRLDFSGMYERLDRLSHPK